MNECIKLQIFPIRKLKKSFYNALFLIDIVFPASYLAAMRLLISLVEAILLLSGAGSMEELGESELERFEMLAEHPVCINMAPVGRLRSCGLFSEYQLASLQDYIARTGDILSAVELGTVPGFTQELAGALRFFISFESHSPAGTRHREHIRQELMLRDVLRDGSRAFSGKYHLQYGESMELYLSAKDKATGSVSLYGKRPWKLVLGDFNARFGQGLLSWSGFSLSGFSTVSAFCRNASGISGTGSFSPSGRGLAAGYEGRSWNAASALNADGRLLCSVSWLGRSGNAGVNAVVGRDCPGMSLDWKKAFGHLNLFGEVAYAGKPAFLAGARWEPAYKISAALLVRCYPAGYAAAYAGAARSASKVADETGLAAGVQIRWFSATADLAVHPGRMAERKNNYEQFKSVVSAAPEFRSGGWVLSPVLKWTERMQLSPDGEAFKSEWRNDLRCDLKAAKGGLQGTLRLNCVQVSGKSPGGLGYFEIGYKTPSDTARLQWSVFVRGTVCKTDGWASRIYAYERDLPGSFNVPAWYDRKSGASLVASISSRHKRCRHRLNIRLSTRDFKIQYQLWIY